MAAVYDICSDGVRPTQYFCMILSSIPEPRWLTGGVIRTPIISNKEIAWRNAEAANSQQYAEEIGIEMKLQMSALYLNCRN